MQALAKTLHSLACGDFAVSPKFSAFRPIVLPPPVSFHVSTDLPATKAGEDMRAPGDETTPRTGLFFGGKSAPDPADCSPQLEKELDALRHAILVQSLNDAMRKFRLPDSVAKGSLKEEAGKEEGQETSRTRGSPGLHPSAGGCEDQRKVGLYTITERSRRILYYKRKLKKWRAEHPVSRVFRGRKKVAFNKPRVNGKFARCSE